MKSETEHNIDKNRLREQWEEALFLQGTEHVLPLLLERNQNIFLWCKDTDISITVGELSDLAFNTPLWWLGKQMKPSDVNISQTKVDLEQIFSPVLLRIPNGLMFSGVFSPKLLCEFPHGTTQKVGIAYGNRLLELNYRVHWKPSQSEPSIIPNPLVSPGTPFSLICPPWFDSLKYTFADLPQGYSLNEMSGVIQKGKSNLTHILNKDTRASKGSLRIQVDFQNIKREFIIAKLT